MAQKPTKKPPVDVVTDEKSGVSVTIFYDREHKTFYGDVPQLGTVRDADLNVVVKEVQEKLAASRSFDWKPIIIVTHGGGSKGARMGFGRSRNGAHLGFEFWRSELAPRPGKGEPHSAKFIERPHALDVVGKSAPPWASENREKGADVHDHYESAEAEIIPYTEENWQALFRLKAATEATYAQLVELFKKPALLATMGAAPRLLAIEAAQPEPTRGRVRRAPQPSR